MAEGSNQVGRSWTVDPGWGWPPSLVQLFDGGRLRFQCVICDGVRHSFGSLLHAQAVVTFEIRGRRAEVRVRVVRPSFRTSLRRAFSPAAFVGAVAAGVITGGSSYAGEQVAWEVYELTFDGVSQGSWIRRVPRHTLEWKFSPPGGWTPDRTSWEWPAAEGSAR